MNETLPITIVSGLPRSGTSLMMKMLEAGGMEALTDNVRVADVDNPRGYYEFEPVKKLKEDTSWLGATQGKVFKMVSMLLRDLPPDYCYKVIFMRREMREILASQAKMLERLGNPGKIADEQMAALFNKHLVEIDQWIRGQRAIEMIYVDYNELTKSPRPVLERIVGFLGRELNVEAMASTIDPSLYRNRA